MMAPGVRLCGPEGTGRNLSASVERLMVCIGSSFQAKVVWFPSLDGEAARLLDSLAVQTGK